MCCQCTHRIIVFTVIFLALFGASILLDHRSGWVCLYALYIDSDVSREKGRKVSLECSCKKPTVVLMAEVLNRHGFKYVIEGNKR